MNALGFTLAFMRGSRLAHALNILLLGLGLGTVVLVILLEGAIGDRLRRDAGGVDLVVGAKGSPLQLVLSTVFQADIPTGNIKLADADTIAHDPLVARAVPVALGDAVQGFRIVGTDPDYLTLYAAHLAQGRIWSEPMEAVLGSVTASQLGLHPGDHFIGAHGVNGGGHMHAHSPYVVTGILAPTGSVVDRLALTSVASVWHVHAHHGPPDGDADENEDVAHQITALLLKLNSPFGAVSLSHRINGDTGMQAAVPGIEYARLLGLAGFGLEVFQGLAGILVISSGLGMLIALYTRLRARAPELAVLRLLGASPRRLFATVLTEALLLGALGALLGIVLGHLGAVGLRAWLPQGHALGAMSIGWRPAEWIVPITAALTALLAALIPAIACYRIPVAVALSRQQP